ncbi:hypothetical protein [Sphingomonas sp. Leaf38]|uniref:hypothetical protein n=1 Tax=Sphingomonas sp. Leaf38 TaxID=1736217 RepID=UPI0006F8CF00|nr:hypothetical protein [Sphingomonas sp. Leaf38]KQN33592.1 hypothetical protein ASE88_00740 [Sphingomonas sp. Leaf38]
MVALPEILSGMAPGLLGMTVAVGAAVWFKVEQRKANARRKLHPVATVATPLTAAVFGTKPDAVFAAARGSVAAYNAAVSDVVGSNIHLGKAGKINISHRDITSAWMETAMREDTKD